MHSSMMYELANYIIKVYPNVTNSIWQYGGKSMVYVPIKAIIHLMMLVLMDYSRPSIKLKLNCITEKKDRRAQTKRILNKAA